MDNKKMKIIALSSLMAVAAGAAGIKLSQTTTSKALGSCDGNNHHGNHYAAKEATCVDAGNLEFYACCDCHEQFLSNPGGSWVDCGVYSEELSTSHIAYVAPTGEHDYKYTLVAPVEAGQATIQLVCEDCDATSGDPIVVPAPTAFDKIIGADYADYSDYLAFSTDSDSKGQSTKKGFVFDEEKGRWQSDNKGIDYSSAYLNFNAVVDGTLSFSVCDSSELNWDYAYIYSSTTDKIVSQSVDGSGTAYSEVNLRGLGTVKSFKYEVSAGAVITVRFDKDSSGYSGDDRCYISDIKFGCAAFADSAEEVALTFDSNGGSAVDPIVILKGDKASLPTPTKSGFYFGGWYLDRSFNEAADETTTYADDTKLFAKWYDLSEACVLMGTHFGGYFSSASSSSITNSSGYTRIEVDFFGNYTAYTYSSQSPKTGKITGYDSETKIVSTKDGELMTYDATSGLITLLGSKTPSTSTTLCVYKLGATSVLSSSSVSAACLDSNYVKVIQYNKDASTTTIVDLRNAKIHVGGSYNAIYPSTISSIGDLSSCFLYELRDAKGAVIGKFNKTTPITGDISGVYAIGGETLYVAQTKATGGYVRYTGHTSPTSDLTITNIADNEITVESTGSYSYTFTIDSMNGTAAVVENKFVVTYNWNGHMPEDAVSSKTYWQNAYVYASDAPKVTNDMLVEGGKTYKFMGWFTDADLTNKWTSTYRATQNYEVFAKWVECVDVTISFVSNGGSDCDPITVSTGFGYTDTLPSPTLSGYKFLGWFYDEGLTQAFSSSQIIEESFTLYAKWIAIPAWSDISTAEETSASAGVYTVAGTTSKDFLTYYAKVYLEAGKYDWVSAAITNFGYEGSTSSKYYGRFSILDSEGAGVATALTLSDSNGSFTISADGYYYVQANVGGNVAGGSSNYTMWATFNIGFAKGVSNSTAATAAAYTLGTVVTPTFPLGNSYSTYYKVTLTQGKSYKFSVGGSTGEYCKLYLSSDGKDSGSGVIQIGTGTTKFLVCYSGNSAAVTNTIEFAGETGEYYIICSGHEAFSVEEVASDLEIDGSWVCEEYYLDFVIGSNKLVLNDLMNSVEEEELVLTTSTESSWTFYGSGVYTYQIVIEKDGENYVISSYEIDGSEYLWDGATSIERAE